MYETFYAALLIILFQNLLVFAAYGIDKHRASRGRWRIPEKRLLMGAALFGAAGALFGMRYFRHKTMHKKFMTLVPLFLIVQIIFLALVVNNI